MKYFLAFLACAAIWITYITIGTLLFNWKEGGGVLPMLILFAVMGYVWRCIIKKPLKKHEKDSENKPTNQ